MLEVLRKLFDTSEKEVRGLQPIADDVFNLEDDMAKLSDEELKAKTEEFKKRLDDGQTLEDILVEAFAVVREASWRTLHMKQFPVQIIGGAVLHQGRIAEMKTGEGKTLVAVAPMYLNALTGRGAHLVTVNDYLARRDAVWMGAIYDFLGLTIGVIQGQSQDSDELGGSFQYEHGYKHEDPRYLNLRQCTRREAYLCDIVYGTNHEFGFDYLRDNMAFDKAQLSMRELNYAIIDEVDSILVDEARTPHIISGPSNQDVSVYNRVDKVVRKMNKLQIEMLKEGEVEDEDKYFTSDKKSHSASLTEVGMDFLEQEMEIDNIADEPLLFHHVNAAVKAYALFEKDVDYVVRGQDVVIIDENTGRPMFGRRYSDGLHQALEAKEGVTVQRESQTVATITFQNLFRMYNKLAGMTGTAKTEEDEFRKIYGLDVIAIPTNVPMVRQDQDDIVYKSLDAKFRGIAREILRLYSKQQPVLVGTRSIEMSEQVSARLTAEMLQKLLLADMILDKVVNEKSSKDFKNDAKPVLENPLKEVSMDILKQVCRKGDLPANAQSEEAMKWFMDQTDLDESKHEFLKEALGHGIPHNVLNAKYHEREALIISEAGRLGAVTIATNMAGRGVDILLGGRVHDDTVERDRTAESESGGLPAEYADTFQSFRRGGQERAAPPLPLDEQERGKLADQVRELGGLYILGTERHESRRIDNQLRGRAGRQGDPGESRFFVSLEDQLWKIFNAQMLENPMLKAWPAQEEVKAKFISGMIHKTQERIENHYFEARKHVLEYDDVLNAQREKIYSMRREILLGKDCRPELLRGIEGSVGDIVEGGWSYDEDGHPTFDKDSVYEKLNELFPLVDYITKSQFEEIHPDELAKEITAAANKAYDKKIEQIESEQEGLMEQIERQVYLRAVNDKWMDHLQMVDYIREGIGLRGYGQQDPLVAYKQETFDLFESTTSGIRDQAVSTIFRAQVQRQAQQPQQARPQMMRVEDEQAANENATKMTDSPRQATPQGGTQPEPAGAPVGVADVDQAGISKNGDSDIDWSTVGRNDPCPCGSGKKFKQCHYRQLRQDGVI